MAYPLNAGGPFGLPTRDFFGEAVFGMPTGRNVSAVSTGFTPPLTVGIQCDGVNDRLQSTFAPFAWPTTGFTMMGWVRPASVVGNRFVAGTTSTYGGNGIHIYQNSALLRFTAQTGVDLIVFTGLLASRRYHWAFTMDASRAWVFYVDGLSVASGTLTLAQYPTTYGGHFFAGVGLGFFQGNLCNWAFFSRVLSQDELLGHVQQGTLPILDATGIQGYYPLDGIGPGATQTYDASGLGRHLDLINMVANPFVAF